MDPNSDSSKLQYFIHQSIANVTLGKKSLQSQPRGEPGCWGLTHPVSCLRCTGEADEKHAMHYCMRSNFRDPCDPGPPCCLCPPSDLSDPVRLPCSTSPSGACCAQFSLSGFYPEQPSLRAPHVIFCLLRALLQLLFFPRYS